MQEGGKVRPKRRPQGHANTAPGKKGVGVNASDSRRLAGGGGEPDSRAFV